jgi:hypothetical protein
MNPKEKEKPHYSLRPRCSPQLQGSLGQAQLARPTARPLAGLGQWALLARARLTVTMRGHVQSGTVASSPSAK